MVRTHFEAPKVVDNIMNRVGLRDENDSEMNNAIDTFDRIGDAQSMNEKVRPVSMCRSGCALGGCMLVHL